jgi:arylsulfatase A-like enzyme
MQDPDGFGFLYNRAGSHGPGLKPLPPGEHLDRPKGAAGDRHATERFVAEAVLERKPALAVLWLSEPDHTGHVTALGGPEHRAALAAADACVAHVLEAVQRLDPDGRELLLMVTSDHGQETTERVIDVTALLVEAGLKDGMESRELVAASQGTAALFFAAPQAQGRLPALLEFLAGQDWAQEVYADGAPGVAGLDAVGLAPALQLVAAVSLRKTDAPNAHGVPGGSDIMFEPGGLNRPGCGQHGGTGAYEQAPFLLVRGAGFRAGGVCDAPSSCIDLAPTILRHLGQPLEGLDGRPLQER